MSVVILVEPRSIPKTTSGKIQRHKCKLGYKDGSLKVAYKWEANASTGPIDTNTLLGMNDDTISEASFVSATCGDDIETPRSPRSNIGSPGPAHSSLTLASPAPRSAKATDAAHASHSHPQVSPEEVDLPSPVAIAVKDGVSSSLLYFKPPFVSSHVFLFHPFFATGHCHC